MKFQTSNWVFEINGAQTYLTEISQVIVEEYVDEEGRILHDTVSISQWPRTEVPMLLAARV